MDEVELVPPTVSPRSRVRKSKRGGLIQLHGAGRNAFHAERVGEGGFGGDTGEGNAVAAGFRAPEIEVVPVGFRIKSQILRMEPQVAFAAAFAVQELGIAEPVGVDFGLAMRSENDGAT